MAHRVFTKHGLQLNFARGKSEVAVRIRGAGAGAVDEVVLGFEVAMNQSRLMGDVDGLKGFDGQLADFV